MKPIVATPNAVLTTPAKHISTFDKKLSKLIHDMKASLRATTNPKGVGLAAPQIGVPYRVFITRPTDKSEIRVFINPEIVSHSEELTDGIPERERPLEGCLSIPKIWGKVHRFTSITLAYQDETGSQHKEKFSGFLATICQHETDHINGILFTRRVLEQKGKLFQTATDEHGKEILDEITI